MNKGTSHSEAAKQKMRAAAAGRIPPNQTGKTWRLSDDAKTNIRCARMGKHHSEVTKKRLSRAHMGKRLSESTKLLIGAASRNRGTPWLVGKKQSLATRLKRSQSAPRGSDNHNWRGGITEQNQKIRASLEYKLWREAVFVRDDYTCQECGDDKGGNLNADHIKPFAWFPELRFDVGNGRTLCVPCHRQTPTFGRKSYQYQPVEYAI